MTEKAVAILVQVLVLVGLYLTSLYSYLLFHTLVETYIVVIAGSIFVLAWNSKKSLDNDYLLFIGISYLFVGIIEMLHTLAYKGMGIFRGFDANLPTQLWIAARYMESLSLLIAPFFLRRKLNHYLVLMPYAAATLLLLVSVFYWRIFPDCFIEGIGLTPFKIISEYIIILIFATSIALLVRNRWEFERDILWMLVGSIVLSIFAELFFTFYISVYGLSNLIGHFLTLLSFYLVYRAIIVTGVTRPLDLLFRNLARSEASLKKAKEGLEATVAERTVELTRMNEQVMAELNERRRAEETALESEGRFRDLYENAPNAYFSVGMDGLIRRCNRRAGELLGYGVDELLGRPAMDLYAESEHGKVKASEVLQRFGAGETVRDVDLQMQKADGHPVWISLTVNALRDAQGRVAESRSMVVDISERKQAGEALKQAEEKYRSIFENAVEGIFQSTPEGRYLSVNPALARMHGYDSPEDLIAHVTDIGRQLYAIPEDRATFQKALEQHGSVKEFVTQEYRKDGSRIWVSINARAVRGPDGGIRYYEGTVEDISERKQAEEEIRRLNQELEQRVKDRTARLEAANTELDAFAYSVSHDLRAPLRHIGGFLELLRKEAGTVLDEQGRHYMDTISDAAKKMGLLIDDLLSFSRMGRYAMSFQQVDLGTLVRDVIREQGPDTQGRDIHWRMGDLPIVSGDRAMLKIVLVNLLSNAIKFTRTRPNAEIEVECLAGQEAETIIAIRDNGVGFDMTYVDKLFGVFQRLHRADEFEGVGIGLANVRRIISRHGGRTWAEAKPDHGAAFFFALPRTLQGGGDEKP